MNADQTPFDHILKVLRQWGWETGVEKLEAKFAAAPEAAGHALWQWLRAAAASESGGLGELPAGPGPPELLGWVRAGQALAAKRRGDYRGAHARLDQAAPVAEGADPALRATLAHYRGTVCYNEGQDAAALPHLHAALELFGREHFVTGRVLDTLGMVYAVRDNHATAREFYLSAIKAKEHNGDRPGLALSHGQLGRLALDWGDLAAAEQHFCTDLKITLDLGDQRGAAQMYNHLGQVALAAGRLAEAGEALDESIRRARQGNWTITEGYARKDRALAHLAAGEADAAGRQADAAEALFRAATFAEGLAHVDRARGILRGVQGHYDEAERALGAALAHFEGVAERAEVARTQWELAQVVRARGADPSVVTAALLRALDSAERCRRHVLVGQIEAALRQADEAAHCRHIYQRARGRGIREDTIALHAGRREEGTVLFLDLQGSTDYVRATDLEVVLVTLNQMLADLAGVLERYGLAVTVFLGDGFMALARGEEHARRGVDAALGLAGVLDEFNRPRRVLGLPLFHARLGLSTGEIVLGNVGTYHKMDFTALGATVNLAARLQVEAEPGQPCVSQGTYEQVREWFHFREEDGRLADLKGIGIRRVWDVVGPKSPAPSLP